MSKWEVQIHRAVGYWLDEIYVFRHQTTNEGQFIEFMQGGDPPQVKRVPYQAGMATDKAYAFIRLDPQQMGDFLMAFRDACKDFNLPNSDEQRIRGELDATKKHLEDFQKLVFDRRVK